MAAVCDLRNIATIRRPKSSPVATTGKKFADIGAAVKSGLVQGCPPFPNGVDLFGFFNSIDEAEAQRYADVEVTHGRVAMLAAVGFLVGEKVEGSSFLFDQQVTVGTFGFRRYSSGLCWVAFFCTRGLRGHCFLLLSLWDTFFPQLKRISSFSTLQMSRERRGTRWGIPNHRKFRWQLYLCTTALWEKKMKNPK